MSINIPDLRKLKPTEWQSILFSLLATLCPGALILFKYRPELFAQLDIAKLILLSLALTLPVVIINLLVALPHALLNAAPKSPEDDLFSLGDLYFYMCMFAALILYISIAISYLFSLTFREFCYTASCTEILIGTITWSNFFRHVKK